ncbi:hypothetical protein HYH02_010521 [Chlamydomonas schloesseri]|uniref:Uncharacterized protein n=1 Tax=Chlamydomonas schloesseri TaxID=2026947 RepID=A0A835T9E8_9CHLO|nr:hypothetical protein HYH02_010521 [Chlamydomonas schloesseri]|eukprot:KAG2439891.1 hypothetical protein HYH02_010521 [Chlamydomonas schloesseri]
MTGRSAGVRLLGRSSLLLRFVPTAACVPEPAAPLQQLQPPCGRLWSPLPLGSWAPTGTRGLAAAAAAAGTAAGGGPPDERLHRASRLIDGVVNRVVDRLSRGDFEPRLGPNTSSSGHAGGAGEAGGGGGAMDTGRGAVTYDYEAVPRSIDIDAFRRALSSALTEHAGAVGAPPTNSSGGAGAGVTAAATAAARGQVGAAAGGSTAGAAAAHELATRLVEAGPQERQMLADRVAHTVTSEEMGRMLAEEPLPVVRSRLADMLGRGGFGR